MSELWRDVPKGYLENLKYRRELRDHARRDHRLRAAINTACKDDILFFFNAFCISEGTDVVTDRGPIPIERILASDLVWDGDNWVQHMGLVCKGEKPVIDAYGIYLTHDHKVWTNYGWQIASKRYDRASIRLPGGYRKKRKDKERSCLALSVRLRGSEDYLRIQFAKRTYKKLRLHKRRCCNSRMYSKSDLLNLAGNDFEMLQREEQVLPLLRRTRNKSLRPLAGVRELFGGRGTSPKGEIARSQEQRWRLLPRKLPVGYCKRTSQQPKGANVPDFHGRNNIHGSSLDCRHHKRSYELQDSTGVNRRQASSAKPKEATVYDLINCGPRQAFTVIDRHGKPLLVHNCWLEEPRPELDIVGQEKTTVIPFTVWPHQEPVIVDTYAKLGFEDVGWEKTRGEGASWIACLFAVHDWLFIRRAHVGLVSRNMDFADTTDNMDSLFAKIDWSLKMFPRWMVGVEDIDWRRSITKHTLRNLRNDATVAAFAAVSDVGSGGRKRWFLMDELAKFPKPQDQEAMASTQAVTKSRLIVSTYKGSYGAYYDLMTAPNSKMLKCVLDWRDNPTKNRGLYRMIGGTPVAVDPINNPLPPHYNPPTREVSQLLVDLKRRGYNLEARTRSPWYDNECIRPGANPVNIAEELDRDPSGSMSKYFLEGFHEIVKETTALEPITRGEFQYDGSTLETGSDALKFTFTRGATGQFVLWCGLDHRGRPPKAPYAIGCDIAAGGGGAYSSNSVLTVVNLSTGEQVLEYASNTIEPAHFADLAVAVGHWFWTAFLNYEDNGPGGAFGRRLAERRYPDVFKQVPYWKIARNQISDPKPGFHTDLTSKQVLFSDLNMSVVEKSLIIRSVILKEELHQYIRDKDKIVHSHNPGGDATHGDRVIAIGICNQAKKLRPQPKPGEEEAIDPLNPPANTMAGRMKIWEEEAARDRLDEEREPGALMGVGASVGIPGYRQVDLY